MLRKLKIKSLLTVNLFSLQYPKFSFQEFLKTNSLKNYSDNEFFEVIDKILKDENEYQLEYTPHHLNTLE